MSSQIVTYTVILETASNGYRAYSPDVTGCVASGSTVDQAVRNLKETLRVHISSMEIIPEPNDPKVHLKNIELEPDLLITAIEIRLSERNHDHFIEGVHGRAVTFKVIAKRSDSKPTMKVIKNDQRGE